MQIQELGFSAQGDSLGNTVKTGGHSALDADIGFFSSLLERSALPPSRGNNNQERSLLVEAGQHVKGLESILARSLKSTNKGSDPDDFKQYPRELSNVVLTSQLLVKSLGKATQCIDKISNLQ